MKHYLRAGGALLGLLFSIALYAAPAAAATEYAITPSTTTVQSGESVDFTISKTASGTTTDVTGDAVLTTTDPSGTIQNATYYAGTVGSWKVTATVDSHSTVATITVTPGVVTRLVVSPHDETVKVKKGATQQFTAVAYDGHNNEVTDAKITWSGVYSIGSISKSGLFTANATGSSQVIATSGEAIDTVTVTVFTPAPETPATTNTNSNSNTAVNQSTDNTNQQSETAAPAEENTTEESTDCTTMPWWGWLVATIGFLTIVYGYHHLIRKKQSSLWLLGTAVLTGLALWLYFAYRCGNQFTWAPWVIGIGAGILAVLRPQTFQTTYGSDL